MDGLTFKAAKPTAQDTVSIPKSVKRGTTVTSSDEIFKILTIVLATSIIVIVALTIYVLVKGSLPVWAKFGISFITGTGWDPNINIFGVFPYILGTVITAGIAIIIGVPISLGIAIFLAEMAPSFVKTILSNVIDLLAAVPSVIYGLWGLFVFKVWVVNLIETPLSTNFGTTIPVFSGTPFGLDFLTAGLILTIMVIPTISAISREVILAVPWSQREAAYSLGATRWETTRLAVLSYARSGIFGATILGLGRAVGETMAVTMVIGNATGAFAMPKSLFGPGQTLASIIANEFNEADPATLHPAALIGAGLVLFMLAAAINIFAVLLVTRILRVKGRSIE